MLVIKEKRTVGKRKRKNGRGDLVGKPRNIFRKRALWWQSEDHDTQTIRLLREVLVFGSERYHSAAPRKVSEEPTYIGLSSTLKGKPVTRASR